MADYDNKPGPESAVEGYKDNIGDGGWTMAADAIVAARDRYDCVEEGAMNPELKGMCQGAFAQAADGRAPQPGTPQYDAGLSAEQKQAIDQRNEELGQSVRDGSDDYIRQVAETGDMTPDQLIENAAQIELGLHNINQKLIGQRITGQPAQFSNEEMITAQKAVALIDTLEERGMSLEDIGMDGQYRGNDLQQLSEKPEWQDQIRDMDQPAPQAPTSPSGPSL